MKVKAIALALAVGAGVLVFGAGTANATETLPTDAWQVRDAGTEWIDPAADSKIKDSTTVELVRKDAAKGTSVETTNLNIVVNEKDKVTVDYELKDFSSEGTAIRLFVYNEKDMDTWSGRAPNALVAVPAGNTKGTLELEVNFTGTIGTAGLTYDAGDVRVPGTVVFTNLKVKDTLILFQARPCQYDDTLLSDDEECKAPSSAPATTPPTTTPVANNDTLPVTGTDVKTIGILGALLFVIGGVAIIVGRKRRETE